MVLEFEISDESFKSLLKIEKAKYAEFRDDEFDSLEDFKKSKLFLDGTKDENWFRARNFCDYKDINELLKYGLIDDGERDSWHPTYYVSEFGKQVLSKKRQRSLKLKDILENK